jgi:lipopolysaccharide transport system permease protein
MSTPTTDSAAILQPPVKTLPINAEPAVLELPDEPLTIIEPSRPWSLIRFSELWAHRELLYFLTWRDLKVRYKQTILGVSWAITQPLLMTLIFTVFLGMLVRVPTGDIPYALVAYTGLLPWMFVSGGIMGCSMSLVGNTNLITKVYFPRVLIPAAYIATRLIDFTISFLILAGLMLFYRFGLGYPLRLSWSFAALPILIFLMTLFTLSAGILVSSLNVKYRDLTIGLPLFIQLWMFVSPVVYPSDTLVPKEWRTVYFLNPLAGLIEGFRSALLGREFNKFGLAVSAVVTVALFFFSVLLFRRVEKSFADVI